MTTTKTRTQIEDIAENRCRITYQDAHSDEFVTMELFAPSSGGYVKVNDGRRFPQICERLAATGSTLDWSPAHGRLSDMIRREYRRMRAAEKRI